MDLVNKCIIKKIKYLDNKAYYIGKGYSIEEVSRVNNKDNHCIIKHDNGDTNIVLPSTCFNSKKEAIKQVIENFERDIEQYEYELVLAQDNLYLIKHKLQKFKSKYEI